MERLQTEDCAPKLSAKDIARQQLINERKLAAQELNDTTIRLTSIIDSCDEKLARLEGVLGNPSLIVELRTWTTEYDVYTYNTVPGSEQTRDYQVNTDDIQKVCELVVGAIKNDRGLLYKARERDLALGRIGMVLGAEVLDLPLGIGSEVQKTWVQEIDKIPKE